MNHIYKTVYNPRLGLWQAVAENARGQGKSRRSAARMLAGLLALAATQALAADYTIDGGSTVTVTASTPQSWSTSDTLRAGQSSSGSLNIEQGGAVSSAGAYVGNTAGSTGTITVDGAGSTWTSNANLSIGLNGNGTLNIRNGGSASTTGGATTTSVGGNSGGSGVGTITVTGSGSTWNIDLLDLNATGTLSVQNGGSVSTGGSSVGGAATVTGGGSSWNDSNAISVSGRVNVLDGGTVSSGLGFTIDGSAGSPPVVTVNGSGATLTVTNVLKVAENGVGTLNIQNGGAVSAPSLHIGEMSGASGTVEVTGSASSLTASGGLFVGISGSGTLNIRNGASVNSGAAEIGRLVGGHGTVTVDGSGSSWTTGGLYVGAGGSGTLNILNGAAVQGDDDKIASTAGETGTVTVSGSNSSWNGSNLRVGELGTGTLTIQDGATVNRGATTLGVSNGSSGALNLLGTASARGVLQTSSLGKGAGAATFNWNGGILRATGHQANYLQGFSAAGITVGSAGAWLDTNGYNVGVSTAGLLTGSGGFTKLGAGTLTMAGANSYSGNTTVSAGTLQFDTYNQSGGQTLTLGAASSSSHGQLAVTGTATFQANASLAVDVASANTLALGQTLSSVISAGTLNASTFSVSDNSALFNFEAVLNGNAVDLSVSQGLSVQDAATGAGLGPAAGAAQVLDTLLNNAPGGDMGTVVTALGSLGTPRDVARATAQTLPLVSGVAALQGVLGAFNRVLQNRQDTATAATPSALTYASLGGAGDLPASREANSGQAWGRTFGAQADQSDHKGSAGFNAGTWGLALGVDAPWSDAQRLGLAYAYARTQVNGKADLAGTAQNAGIDTHLLALYGSRELAGGLTLDWQTDLGLSRHQSQRFVNFGGLARTASAAYDSYSAHAGIAVARRVKLGADTTLMPGLSADYTWLHSRGYTESGAGALNLQVDAQSTDALVLGADLKFGHRLNSLSDLSGYLGLGYDTINQRNTLMAAYIGAPTQQFSTSTAAPSPWIARAGLAYSRTLANGTDVSVHYDVQTRGPLLNQSASVKATWVF
jgi:T5SS/PEP-CTERM-associated repeat protein/autotransporter-associated beta strand protein